MGKKNLTKSFYQKEALEQYYEKSKGEWEKEDLQAIASELGLTRQQVYKFLWDKKNSEKKDVLKQAEEKFEASENDIERHTFQYKNSQIQTPITLNQAIQYIVDPSVSIWAINILKQQGWQLVVQNMNEESLQNQKCKQVSPYQFTKPSTMKRSFQNEMIEIQEDQAMFRLNKFEMVPEEIEDDLPFLYRQHQEVKEQFVSEENVFFSNMNPFIEFKYTDKNEKKGKFTSSPIKFDMIKSDKASSEENFEPKL